MVLPDVPAANEWCLPFHAQERYRLPCILASGPCGKLTAKRCRLEFGGGIACLAIALLAPPRPAREGPRRVLRRSCQPI